MCWSAFAPLNRWVARHLPQVEVWFERYGKWTLFFGYFIAGLRHFTALAAGMSKVKIAHLRCSTLIRAACLGGLFRFIGYYLGAEWESLARSFNRGALIAAGIVAVIAVAGWFLRRKNPIA